MTITKSKYQRQPDGAVASDPPTRTAAAGGATSQIVIPGSTASPFCEAPQAVVPGPTACLDGFDTDHMIRRAEYVPDPNGKSNLEIDIAPEHDTICRWLNVAMEVQQNTVLNEVDGGNAVVMLKSPNVSFVNPDPCRHMSFILRWMFQRHTVTIDPNVRGHYWIRHQGTLGTTNAFQGETYGEFVNTADNAAPRIHEYGSLHHWPYNVPTCNIAPGAEVFNLSLEAGISLGSPAPPIGGVGGVTHVGNSAAILSIFGFTNRNVAGGV